MIHVEPEVLQAIRAGFGYPDVPPQFGVSWCDVPAGYEAVEYTSVSVKRSVPDWDNPDLDAMWERAQTFSLLGAFLLRDKHTGRPLNPSGPTGISGYGRLRTYGPSFSADGVVVHQNEVLLIERQDTGQLAFPGGYREFNAETNEYEDPTIAAFREVSEETKLVLSGTARVITRGVPPFVTRNTDNSWIEDSAVLIDVSDTPKKELLRPVASDDAKKGSARWVPIKEVHVSKMSPRHAEHIDYLRQEYKDKYYGF